MYKTPQPTILYIKAKQSNGLYKIKELKRYPDNTERKRTIYKNKPASEADALIYELERK